MSCPRRRSLSGCSATSASSSPTTSAWRPSARSASISASEHASRSSSRRATSAWAKRLEANVGERRAAPEAPAPFRRVSAAPAASRPASSALPSRHELLEAVRVAGARLEPQPVAACLREDDVASERLAKPGGDDLNGVVRVRRKLVAPELLDHAIDGNDLGSPWTRSRARSARGRPRGSSSRRPSWSSTSTGPRIRNSKLPLR